MIPSSLPADAQVERRLLKRKLMWWRFLGIVSFCLLLAALVFPYTAETRIVGQEHIARFAIEGIIQDTDSQTRALAEIAENDNAQALLLHINSPGGSISGSEDLYNAVRRVSERKPVAVIMDDVAASGGYIVAIAGDRIIARRNTITGSIGVIFLWLQAEELMDKIGLKFHSIASGPLKAQPNLFDTPSDETLEVTRATVDDAFEWFVTLVAQRRGLSLENTRQLADGRIYTGGQALNSLLIDQIGGEQDAVSWLDDAHDISQELEIRDWTPEPWEELWDWRPSSFLLRLLGREEIAIRGLLSLWLPGV